MDGPDVAYRCEAAWFTPSESRGARWLDAQDDFDLIRNFHNTRDPAGPGYTPADAAKWREDGFRDAGIIEHGVLVSRAALWTYSDTAWELAGVFTLPELRCRGLAGSVCTFVTAAILEAGRVATCHTQPNNRPMRRVAEALGYRRT